MLNATHESDERKLYLLSFHQVKEFFQAYEYDMCVRIKSGSDHIFPVLRLWYLYIIAYCYTVYCDIAFKIMGMLQCSGCNASNVIKILSSVFCVYLQD